MFAIVRTNLTLSVEHLSPDQSNSNKEGFVADLSLTNVKGNIQPTAGEVAELYQGAFGKIHTLYTTRSGILETDRLTVSGTGKQYIVKGKQFFNYDPMQHVEYILEEVL